MLLPICQRTAFECNLLLLEVRSMVPGTQETEISAILEINRGRGDLLRPGSRDEDDESGNGAKEDDPAR
jgi:hypothetical protein